MRSNADIAAVLDHIADFLEVKGESRFRVRAYRKGAELVRGLNKQAAEIFDAEGREGLTGISGIGDNIAGVIEEVIETGRSSLLERLQAELHPQELFSNITGIGAELAENIFEQLNIRTLEELELAAADGRLERVDGFGPKRAEAVKEILASKLSRSRQQTISRLEKRKGEAVPPVELLLSIDAEYREKSSRDELKRIAPRRFNPKGEAWLPIMEVDRGSWHFTVLFSNTEKAHKQDATKDWVVIYYEGDGSKGQCTVVTGKRGPLQEKRVVRGRELECRRYYNGRQE